MLKDNIPSLLGFVNDFQLTKNGGVMAFNAQVRLQVHCSTISLLSEIQILTLPNQMAVYIIEPIHDQFNLPEMFATNDACFSYAKNKHLEICTADKAVKVLITPSLI